MKFSTPQGMGLVVGQQRTYWDCNATTMKEHKYVCAVGANSYEPETDAFETSAEPGKMDQVADPSVGPHDVHAVGSAQVSSSSPHVVEEMPKTTA